MKTHEFLLRKAEADLANSAPPVEGENYVIFGQRKECITPSLLNQEREKLGYNPKFHSPFYQCQTPKPRR